MRIVGFCADCGVVMADLDEEWVISYQGDALIAGSRNARHYSENARHFSEFCPSCGRVDAVWK